MCLSGKNRCFCIYRLNISRKWLGPGCQRSCLSLTSSQWLLTPQRPITPDLSGYITFPVDWKQLHNLKFENYALFGGLSGDFILGCLQHLRDYSKEVREEPEYIGAFAKQTNKQMGLPFSVVKNPPADVRHTSLIPDPQRPHMPQSNQAHEPQLLSPQHPRVHAL